MKKIILMLMLMVSAGAMANLEKSEVAFGEGRETTSVIVKAGEGIRDGAVQMSIIVVDGTVFAANGVADVVSAPFKASTYDWIAGVF